MLFGIVFFIGLAVFLYPNLSNIYATYSQALTIYDYQKEQEKKDEQVKELELAEMKEYNQSLEEGQITYIDPFEEEDLEPEQEEVVVDRLSERLGEAIGHIEIPKINVNTPIYKGTSDTVLQHGIGLLENSSMPVGGASTHSALTGHRGLPSADLFTHIVDLELDDVFYIHSVAGILAYQVEKIETVLPYETESLKIQEGRDLVTLITCTPYMINSHRILITASRIPYVAPEEDEPVSRQMIQYVIENETSIWAYLIGAITVGILLIVVYRFKKRAGGQK